MTLQEQPVSLSTVETCEPLTVPDDMNLYIAFLGSQQK